MTKQQKGLQAITHLPFHSLCFFDSFNFLLNDLLEHKTLYDQPMNVLILNASPRPQGNISRMLETLHQEIEACPHCTVTTVCVSSLHIHPCTGCMNCRSSHDCVLPEDDAQRVLRHIKQCEVLIIGAPCYWGNMPGTLKLLFDRIVYGLTADSRHGLLRPLHKGKRAVIVTTSSTPYPFNLLMGQTRGVVRALREILKWSGFRLVAKVEAGGTRHNPVPEKTFRRCRKIAKQITEEYH